MPAFTFEKIDPPAPKTTAVHPRSSATSKPVGSRGLVGNMLNRLAVTRLKREQVKEATARKKD